MKIIILSLILILDTYQLCAANCNDCDTDVQCYECATSFFINALKTCTRCQDNCKKCDTAVKCTQCLDNFKLDSENCIKCKIATCKNCKDDISKCFTCIDGYIKAADQLSCLQCKVSSCKQCAATSADTLCSTCIDGYIVAADQKSCLKCNVSNCLTCTATDYQTKCQTCKTGFIANTDKLSCKSCSTNCLECDLDKCTKCEKGYSVVNKVCSRCLINFCQKCDTAPATTICDDCLSGYVYSSDKTTCKSACMTTEFLVSTAKPFYCKFCKDKYDGNCASCDATKCLSCVSGYQLYGTECKKRDVSNNIVVAV